MKRKLEEEDSEAKKRQRVDDDLRINKLLGGKIDQPLALTKERLQNLPVKETYVSPKADGQFARVYVGPEGVWERSRSGQVSRLYSVTKATGYHVFDCEKVAVSTDLVLYLIFEVRVFNGIDRSSESLTKRFQMAAPFSFETEKFIILAKPVWPLLPKVPSFALNPGRSFTLSVLGHQVRVPMDGCIFVTDRGSYKHKLDHTIDLIQDSKGCFYTDLKRRRVDVQGCIIPDLEGKEDKRVVEMRWSSPDERWHFVRTRPEKSDSNHPLVIEETMKLACDPKFRVTSTDIALVIKDKTILPVKERTTLEGKTAR